MAHSDFVAGWEWRIRVDRSEAAALLGIPVDADEDAIRRAWRFWARVAHPDAGGDPDHFTRLDRARQTMLATRPLPELVPDQRLPLRQVLHSPTHPALMIWAAVAVLGTALLPRMLIDLVPVPLALAAAPAALAATAWSVWAARAVLGPAADRGHRICLLALFWGPIAIGELLVSTVAGVSLLPVLPLLALPIAAAVALLDPGSGLVR